MPFPRRLPDMPPPDPLGSHAHFVVLKRLALSGRFDLFQRVSHGSMTPGQACKIMGWSDLPSPTKLWREWMAKYRERVGFKMAPWPRPEPTKAPSSSDSENGVNAVAVPPPDTRRS